MNPPGYEVEFLPLERRLQPRRTLSSGSNPSSTERRLHERRVATGDDSAAAMPSDHADARRAA